MKTIARALRGAQPWIRVLAVLVTVVAMRGLGVAAAEPFLMAPSLPQCRPPEDPSVAALRAAKAEVAQAERELAEARDTGRRLGGGADVEALGEELSRVSRNLDSVKVQVAELCSQEEALRELVKKAVARLTWLEATITQRSRELASAEDGEHKQSISRAIGDMRAEAGQTNQVYTKGATALAQTESCVALKRRLLGILDQHAQLLERTEKVARQAQRSASGRRPNPVRAVARAVKALGSAVFPRRAEASNDSSGPPPQELVADVPDTTSETASSRVGRQTTVDPASDDTTGRASATERAAREERASEGAPVPVVIMKEEQPSKWSYSVGVAHRVFEDVTFEEQEFRNWGQQSAGTAASGSTDTPANRAASQANGPYGVQGIASPLDPGMTVAAFEDVNETFDVNVPLDYVRFNGSDDGVNSGSQAGLSLGLSRRLYQKGRWTFSLLGDMQYLGLDVSTTHRGDMAGAEGFTAEQYQHMLVDVDTTSLNGTIIGVINPAPLPAGGPVPGTSTEFAVDNEMSLDLFVLSLGCRASLDKGRLRLNMAAGPTVTFGDMSSSQTLHASWGDIEASYPNPPFASRLAVVDAGTYSETRTDSGTDVMFGAFAELGVAYAVTPNWETGIDLRCDLGASDFATDQASLGMTGYGLRLRLSGRF